MKNLIKTIYLSVFSLLIIGFSITTPPLIQAGEAPGIGKIAQDGRGLGTGGEYSGGVTGGGPAKLVNDVLSFLTGVAAVWLLITIVLSGMKIVQSAKSPEEFYTHMKKIMWSAVGMVVVALAYVIVTWILKTLFGTTGPLTDPIGTITS